jgi:preprotein translocase subunit YajC
MRTLTPFLYALGATLVIPSLTFATEVQAEAHQITRGQFMTQTILYILAALGMFYVLVTRPAVQREDRQKQLLANLKKNDEVLVGDAIYGRVAAIADGSITVEIAPSVRVRVRPEQISKAEGSSNVKELSAAKG